MPTYDYRCRSCGHVIETVHSMREDGPANCEECGGPLVRVLHPAGIIFKGRGFYATDSRAREASEGASPKPATPAASDSTPAGGDSTD